MEECVMHAGQSAAEDGASKGEQTHADEKRAEDEAPRTEEASTGASPAEVTCATPAARDAPASVTYATLATSWSLPLPSTRVCVPAVGGIEMRQESMFLTTVVAAPSVAYTRARAVMSDAAAATRICSVPLAMNMAALACLTLQLQPQWHVRPRA